AREQAAREERVHHGAVEHGGDESAVNGAAVADGPDRWTPLGGDVGGVGRKTKAQSEAGTGVGGAAGETGGVFRVVQRVERGRGRGLRVSVHNCNGRRGRGRVRGGRARRVGRRFHRVAGCR